jgi:hypothetical protein
MTPDSSSQPAQPATSPSATPPAPQTPPHAPAHPGKPWDWTEALDALGLRTIDMSAVQRVRKVLATAGIVGMPLHWIERDAIQQLRSEAARKLAKADELEQLAGPGWTEAPITCANCGAVIEDYTPGAWSTHQCAPEVPARVCDCDDDGCGGDCAGSRPA